MEKTILITLASLLIIDTCVTYSTNAGNAEKTNDAIASPQIKKLHDPKTSLIFSGNSEAGQDILIKTPSLFDSHTPKPAQSQGCNNRVDVKVFF
jgi:hypothetical protein